MACFSEHINADLDIAILRKGEYLRAPHCCIGYAQKLTFFLSGWLRAMIKNHGPSGEA